MDSELPDLISITGRKSSLLNESNAARQAAGNNSGLGVAVNDW